MRHRVTIQSRVDVEYGTYSQESDRATVATVWAQVINTSGTAQVDSRNAGEGVTHQFKIRFRTDVTKQNELLYDNKRYQIATIQVEGDERDRFLVIDANEQDVIGTLDNPSPES
jgi:SPP1 family predicted phage head-tail adaptor